MKKKPYHISLSQIIKGQLAVLAKVRPEASSVELTRNAKGDVQIKVIVTDEDVSIGSDKAQMIYDALATKYAAPK